MFERSASSRQKPQKVKRPQGPPYFTYNQTRRKLGTTLDPCSESNLVFLSNANAKVWGGE